MSVVGDSTTEAIRYDSSEYESVTAAVVESVASTVGVDVLDLPPIHDTIDPDALDTLFEGTNPDVTRDGGMVSFSYGGCYVTVHASGYVDVEEL